METHRTTLVSDLYASIYEKDTRTPAQRQAAENEYDAYEAETGGDISMDEWKKSKLKKKTNEEIELDEEKEAKKDACYKKVKANSKVWPSAYASGRLVQCRKKGADNWNSSKKEEVEAVFATLLDEGIAHNEESAIHIISHMSDEWYESLVENILEEGMGMASNPLSNDPKMTVDKKKLMSLAKNKALSPGLKGSM